MKPLLFTLFILLSGLMLKAQDAQQTPVPQPHQKLIPFTSKRANAVPVPNNPRINNASSRSSSLYANEVLLDYVNPDANYYGNSPTNPAYALFIFPLNSRYTKAMGLANDNDTTGNAEDTNYTRTNPYMNYAFVGFDTLYDNYSQTIFTRKAVDSIFIDTVWFTLSHKNLSGDSDTVIIKVIGLTAAGYPNPTMVYASDTIITDSSLSTTVSHSLDTSSEFYWTPSNLKIAASQFGIAEYYYSGSHFNDTLELWDGFPYFTSEGCYFDNGTNNPILANLSEYYPESYSFWSDQGAVYPTSSGGDLFYPCGSSTQTTFTPGVDGASYIEDIEFYASVRLDTNGLTGIQTLNSTFALTSLYPNPAGQSANLKLQLKNNSNLNIELVDLSGRVVKSLYEANQTIGTQQYQIDLADVAAGAYFVNVIASDGSTDYVKLIVIK